MLRNPPPRRPSFAHHVRRSSWFDTFAAWQDHLETRVADETRTSYGYYLLRFLAHIRLDPGDVTEEVVDRFLAGLKPKGSTVESYKRALKSYYGWAVPRGFHEENPVADLEFKALKYAPAVSLTRDEFYRVVYAAANRRPYPHRAWAVILLVETGARIGSMAAVGPDDVGDQVGQLIRFNAAKGDRPYANPLSPLAALAVRELRALSNGTLLGRGKNTLWSWYHQAAVAAGLPKRKQRAHILRDTFATNLLEAGVSVRVVQELLNHADLSQMQRYAAVTDRRKRQTMAVPVADRFPE